MRWSTARLHTKGANWRATFPRQNPVFNTVWFRPLVRTDWNAPAFPTQWCGASGRHRWLPPSRPCVSRHLNCGARMVGWGHGVASEFHDWRDRGSLVPIGKGRPVSHRGLSAKRPTFRLRPWRHRRGRGSSSSCFSSRWQVTALPVRAFAISAMEVASRAGAGVCSDTELSRPSRTHTPKQTP